MGKLVFAATEQKRYELIQAQRQAEIVAAQAKGRGDSAREEARGVAEATRIKGDAEAAYNAKVAAQYTLGGGAVPFIQIPGTAPDAGRR